MNPLLSRELRGLVLTLLLGAAAFPRPLAAQQPDPLGGLVAEALRANLGFAAERLAERLRARGAAVGRVAAVLLLVAVAAMAVARYV